MLGIIATLKAKPGSESEFESIMGELAAAVRANEPDCTFYALHKGEEEGVYVMLEQYTSEAAFAAHRETTHFKEIGGKLGGVLGGAPSIQILQGVD